MGCGCGSKNRAYSSSGRPRRVLHQVVLDGGKGRVAFQSHDKGAAQAVARSYPGSIVREDGAPTPDSAPTEDAKA
ncbi:hypothetical protein ACH46L_03455 [Streptomyces althioticus]|uniref:hypothetical protein n=1 Tax=Streptomyces althioticus TaxID=83380 RepID=UPI0037B51C5A